MKRHSLFVLLFFLLLLLLIGCSDDTGTDPNVSDTPLAFVYYPMVDGNVWTYTTGSDTHTVSAVTSLPAEYVSWNSPKEKSACSLSMLTAAPPFQTILYEHDSVQSVIADTLYLLHRLNPSLMGDTIYVDGSWPGSVPEPFYEVLVDDDTTVSVAAGTFEHCLRILTVEGYSDDGTVFLRYETCYAPGVGVVYRERTYSLLPPLSDAVMELSSYSLVER